MPAAGEPLALTVMAAPLAIARLPADADEPAWLDRTSWHSVTRTADELSVVCDAGLVPPDVRYSAPWRALQVAGPLDFAMTGILYRITGPLAESSISIFAVSTYDTDYVLVPEERLEEASDCLRRAGMIVNRRD